LSAARLARQLPGRRVFVTGGGSGLGLAIAEAFATDGWTVGLLDREPARLAGARMHLLDAGAGAVHPYVADVTDEAAFATALTAFSTATGGLDVMVNNAGVAAAGAVEATSIADWRWILEINVVGVAIGCRLALPLMARGGGGVVINVASAAAFASGPGMAAYNASKAAVVALTETLAAEHDGDGIRALVAMPGFFPTRLLDTMRAPAEAIGFARRMMDRSPFSAADVAARILGAAADGELHVVVPWSYARLWFFKRLMPARFVRWMARQRARALQRRGGGSTART
jgi:NAD(P)-dependent dehydrogenase (short-subunit alcohol dehydrogenase family)